MIPPPYLEGEVGGGGQRPLRWQAPSGGASFQESGSGYDPTRHQLHEFARMVVEWIRHGDVATVPPLLVQPIAAADVSDVLAEIGTSVPQRRVPVYEVEYARRGWKMFPIIDRVYVNDRARKDLEWRPRYDFSYVLNCLKAGVDPRSALARAVGSKGYHARSFAGSAYPVE